MPSHIIAEIDSQYVSDTQRHHNEYVQNRERIVFLTLARCITLDRIIAVRKDEKYPFVENRFFDPDTYLNEMVGVTRDLESTPELVTLRVTQAHAPYLLTKPLHDSQQLIRKEDNGSIVISLNVIINHELEGKIMALGAFVEVLAPRRLRQSIATQILMAASQYSNQIQ